MAQRILDYAEAAGKVVDKITFTSEKN